MLNPKPSQSPNKNTLRIKVLPSGAGCHVYLNGKYVATVAHVEVDNQPIVGLDKWLTMSNEPPHYIGSGDFVDDDVTTFPNTPMVYGKHEKSDPVQAAKNFATALDKLKPDLEAAKSLGQKLEEEYLRDQQDIKEMKARAQEPDTVQYSPPFKEPEQRGFVGVGMGERIGIHPGPTIEIGATGNVKVTAHPGVTFDEKTLIAAIQQAFGKAKVTKTPSGHFLHQFNLLNQFGKGKRREPVVMENTEIDVLRDVGRDEHVERVIAAFKTKKTTGHKGGFCDRYHPWEEVTLMVGGLIESEKLYYCLDCPAFVPMDRFVKVHGEKIKPTGNPLDDLWTVIHQELHDSYYKDHKAL